MDYLVCQILGKQYLIKPGQTAQVGNLGQIKEFLADKILLEVSDGKVNIGKPFLDKKINFKVLPEVNIKKLRVATYKAKVNYRRVKGSKMIMSQILLESDAAKKT